MWHTIVIALHATSGGIALLAGCVAIARGALFRIYLSSLVAMEVFLVLAIARDWATLASSARALFTVFALLGLFMVGRADRARRMLPSGDARPSASYVDHVGFTLVALFDAFAVILVLDLSRSGWPAAAVGVVIAIAGHFVLRAVRRRLTARSADNRAAGATSCATPK